MKKVMVYICALSLAFSALLTGCGEMRRTDGGTGTPAATPEVTVLPETMMPDVEDGEVRDRDGIITEGDNSNGAVEKKSSAKTDPAGNTAAGTTATTKR